MSPARQPSARMMERRYRHLSRLIARQGAEATARLMAREREEHALSICPDGDACPDPKCQAARAAALRGATWREVFAIVHPEA